MPESPRIPKLSKSNLKDPTGLGPKIKELQKKLLKAIEGTRSKSLDNLLAYTYFDAWERETLIKNFDILLDSLEGDLKKNQKEYFGVS